MNTEELLNSILADLGGIAHGPSDDIPQLGLYMDQVTSFFEEQLSAARRYPGDKILTKTMVNNYTKNNLLPPPEKKKYSREHLILLLFIYYMKNVLSFRDIEQLLFPVTEKYFSKDSDLSIADIYDTIFSLDVEKKDHLRDYLKKDMSTAMDTFSDMPEGNEKEYLKLFSFVAELVFDVYLRTRLLEKITDRLRAMPEYSSPSQKKKH